MCAEIDIATLEANDDDTSFASDHRTETVSN